VSPASPFFKSLLPLLFESPAISLYGFYCHAGNSYASTSLPQASSILSAEVEAVNTAAGLALAVLSDSPSNGAHEQPFVLAVGSTPTAHVASPETKAQLSSVLNGTLELHAGTRKFSICIAEQHFDHLAIGNYPMLDLQQLHTNLVDRSRVAQRVLATVISYYPGRGAGGSDEALCDAGAIAMSKDTGPSGVFGEVIGRSWNLGRISQEHGILTRSTPAKSTGNAELSADDGEDRLELGSMVEIVGQHACLTAAAHPWFYVVDSSVDGGSDSVQDIWVPWKGW
jgi:D-serine deaminase-like pyridoxal phosphate-dependent protein